MPLYSTPGLGECWATALPVIIEVTIQKPLQ